MSDNYEFMKAQEPQSNDDYSPYVDKQFNGYINDINNGVYANSSLTLVNFDLGQIYNSQKFVDTSELYAVLPITMVAAFRTNTAGGLVTPVASSSALCSIKTNFVNLIHQADLQVNGKTIENTQPFLNVARHFQMLSEMSINDLATIGPTLGFAPTLDSVKTLKFNPTAGANGTSGNGLTNNRFIGHAENQNTLGSTAQNTGVGNSALQYKVGRYIDTNNNDNGIMSICTTAQLGVEFRPYYVRNGDYMIWYDFAVIRLSHIFESLTKFGLLRKFDATMRLWVNTGTVNVTVANPNGDTLAYSLTPVNNTFSNTCPLMINYLPGSGGIPTNTTGIVAGLYISRPPTTSFGGINLANAGAAHPLLNCRLYYSQIIVQPDLDMKYSRENANKKVVYRSICSNMYSNIGVGSTWNNLVNAGIVHPTGILCVPFIASTAPGFGDFQWKSCFDSAPATTSPISLTNFQVTVGGQNILQSTLFSTYENFISQVNLAEQLTSSDFGVATGLINQPYWEWSRYYYCNVERSNTADKLAPRNINVSFTNNSNVAIDLMVFIFYSDELEVNVSTGIVTK